MSGRKSLLERWVERRFGGYLHQLNAVRTDRPLRLQQPRSTAVVGGGLAGLTAACLLAERGFRVTLYERNDYLGGKVGSWPYAVLRLWLDRPLPRTVPFFLFTDRVRVLDSISSYHHLEASSAAWARETGGGIYELHSYALPDDLTEPGSVRTQLLEELYLYMPELKPARILHEYLQVRDDFTAFHTGLHAERPEPRTGIPGLVLAATSALLAANELLEAEGLRQEPVYSVPLRGLFARGPRGPGCRESGFQPQ